MDLKSFSGDDFDPKQWINKAWSLSENQNKEVFVANTVSRLQIYMKQLTNSLDETTTQIVTSVPRILEEASALQCEGAVLEQSISSCRHKLDEVESQTGHSILALQRTHKLKASLESAASTLREADKWSALAASIEETLDKGLPTQKDKLDSIIEQVQAMTASIEVLSEAADYDEKRLQLETLYNRLEAAAAAPLLDALTNMDAERTTSYVTLFHSLRRSSPLARCWRRVAASQVADRYRRANVDSLRGLADVLLPGVNAQLEWLANVLKCETPVTELLRLYTDLLLSLDPSPGKIISAAMSRATSPLSAVQSLRDSRDELATMRDTFDSLLAKAEQTDEKIPQNVLKELGRALFAGVRDVMPRLGDLLTQIYLAALDEENTDQYDIVEKSLYFDRAVERFSTSCRSETSGLGGPASALQCARAAETFSTSLTTNLSSHFRLIETRHLSALSGDIGDSSGDSGVLSPLFPACLKLAAAAGKAAMIFSELAARIGKDIEWEEPQNPLHSPSLLLSEAGVKTAQALRSSGVLVHRIAGLRRERDYIGALTDDILFAPAKSKLDKIPCLQVWSNNDALSTELPDYAISPQEYITEIGQYLMTLPQHLEMHLSDKHTPLEYLNRVCSSTCDLLAEKILTIRNMDELGTKRCLTDIAYLSSVVEDLGGGVTPSLANLEKSLRAAAPTTH